MRVDVNGTGIELEVVGDGRPMVLLHGFPDSGRLSRHQVPALRDAGFQVIVPDLRGYGGSDRPEGVDAYSLLFLAGDVLGVLDHLGLERAHVVGHDWGAALHYYRANIPPESYVAPPLELLRIKVPTMGVWSSNDFALIEAQMKGSSAFVDAEWRCERLDGPDHWMQLEAPDAVNRLLVDFLPV
jgi:pimeloyl-ACP methyl ester carboxylesterase